MDISHLIEPSNPEKANTSSLNLTPSQDNCPQLNNTSSTISPSPIPSYRPNTISSLLNYDESDYSFSTLTQNKDKSTNDYKKKTENPIALLNLGMPKSHTHRSPSPLTFEPVQITPQCVINEASQVIHEDLTEIPFPLLSSPVNSVLEPQRTPTKTHTLLPYKSIKLSAITSPLDPLPPLQFKGSTISEISNNSLLLVPMENKVEETPDTSHLPLKRYDPTNPASDDFVYDTPHCVSSVLPASTFTLSNRSLSKPAIPTTNYVQSKDYKQSDLKNEDSPSWESNGYDAIAIPSPVIYSDAKKPRLYDTPPIWAQSHRKLKKMCLVVTKSYRYQKRYYSQSSPLAQPHYDAFPKVPNKSNLSVSLTDVLPFEDVTRKVTEWIIAKLQFLGYERPYARIELKFGQILFKESESRLTLPVATETVINPEYARRKTTFRPTLSEKQFTTVKSFLDELVQKSEGVLCNSNTISAHPANYTKDMAYLNSRGPGELRATYNQDNKLVNLMVKRSLDHLVIFSPRDLLDFQVTVTVEHPHTKHELHFSQMKPVSERFKNRKSYSHQKFQMDLTTVTENTNAEPEFELELEIAKELIPQDFIKLSHENQESFLEFEKLMRFVIDNTRLILRQLSL